MQMEDSSIASRRDTFLFLFRWFGDGSGKELDIIMQAYSPATKRLRQRNQQFEASLGYIVKVSKYRRK